MFTNLHPVHYIPIATTILSALFFWILINRWRERGGSHLLWWAIGIFTYGLGTGLESAITLLGNNPALNKAWYIAGAILGGYPLAQGSVYLHLKRSKANLLSLITVPMIVLISILVALSPTDSAKLLSYKPGGAAIAWQWLRGMTPIINTYAVVFLIGSAIWSSIYFARTGRYGRRSLGNALIALGALLPGIGGGMAKAGMVEALYIGEFCGLIFIIAGFFACVSQPIEKATTQTSSLQDAA